MNKEENQIYLEDILDFRTLLENDFESILLIRHSHINLNEMERKGLIEEYQSFQKKPAFLKAKYVVSFLAGEKNTAIFYGIYRVESFLRGKKTPEYSSILRPYCSMQNRVDEFKMELKEIENYKKFKKRIVIDWVVPRGWYNTFGQVKSKPVIKILPYKYVADFPGLMNILLKFNDLKQIVENPDSHEEWYNSLTRLQAIYLILDVKTGFQYVGSTNGEFGLWQRWSTYVKTQGTGNNVKLEEMKIDRVHFQYDLQFSILEVLTKTVDKDYCLKKESLWKKKLGTRDHGLNSN